MNSATPYSEITRSEVTPQKVTTLKKRSDFLRLRSGKYCHTTHLILQCKPRDSDLPDEGLYRAGYTVTTKAGNSVERSRIKRRLREAVREVFPRKAKATNDYVLIAKRPTLSGDFSSILKDLSLALDRVHGNGANGGKHTRKSGKHNSGKLNQD